MPFTFRSLLVEIIASVQSPSMPLNSTAKNEVKLLQQLWINQRQVKIHQTLGLLLMTEHAFF